MGYKDSKQNGYAKDSYKDSGSPWSRGDWSSTDNSRGGGWSGAWEESTTAHTSSAEVKDDKRAPERRSSKLDVSAFQRLIKLQPGGSRPAVSSKAFPARRDEAEPGPADSSQPSADDAFFDAAE